MVPRVIDYVPEFVEALKEQLEKDERAWGDTWLHRPIEGQEERTVSRYNDYFDMYFKGGVPVPWLKVIGGALINWIREQHPEIMLSDRTPLQRLNR